MKDIIFKYYSDEDILFIQLSNKKTSIGSNDFEEGVTIFRNPKDKKDILAIEIIDFSNYKSDKVQLEKNTKVNFAPAFQKIRMFSSLHDIAGSAEFEETLKIWGFKKVENKFPDKVQVIDFKIKESELYPFA
jgi:hypothetical protein